MIRPTDEAVAEYIGEELEPTQVSTSVDLAVTLVDDFISGAFKEVPQNLYDQWVKDTAHALYKRADTVTGTQQIVEVGSLTINRSNRDPLHLSYPSMRRYVLPL